MHPRGAIEFVETFEQIDIKDEQLVFEYVKQTTIDIVYSIGSDLGMVTVAVVSDKLKLPSLITPENYEVLVLSRNRSKK